MFAVGAAEEAAAGGAGTPRGEEEAEALGRTPEQRPRERLVRWQGKRREGAVLRVGGWAAGVLTQRLCPGCTTVLSSSQGPSVEEYGFGAQETHRRHKWQRLTLMN